MQGLICGCLICALETASEQHRKALLVAALSKFPISSPFLHTPAGSNARFSSPVDVYKQIRERYLLFVAVSGHQEGLQRWRALGGVTTCPAVILPRNLVTLRLLHSSALLPFLSSCSAWSPSLEQSPRMLTSTLRPPWQPSTIKRCAKGRTQRCSTCPTGGPLQGLP